MKTKSEKGNQTYQKMIEVARELFHKNGIRATSVDQILEASGTGKSQFYHYFKSKEGLIRAVLSFYCDVMKSDQGPNQIPIESLDDLEKWFGFHIEMQRSFNFERCCPVGAVAAETEANQKTILGDVDQIFSVVRNYLIQSFVQMKSKGLLVDQADPESLAEFCITTTQGGFLLSKVKRESFPIENAVRHTMAYLRSFEVSGKCSNEVVTGNA